MQEKVIVARSSPPGTTVTSSHHLAKVILDFTGIRNVQGWPSSEHIGGISLAASGSVNVSHLDVPVVCGRLAV